MTFFKDLSIYAYHGAEFGAPNTVNIGWLALGHEFPTKMPSEDLLDLVWSYCKFSVAQTRGVHECEFCPSGDWHRAERNGERLLLGTSEIRVLSPDGAVYAAPTLIYHYISIHHYSPPEEFVRALSDGPKPPTQEYFKRIESLGLEWRPTSVPDENAVRFRF